MSHLPTAPLAVLLERHLQQAIPLSSAMGLAVADHDSHSLSLSLPLAPNRNDKGCAFGGSLASAMTLAGWCLAWRQLRQQALPAEIYVADSQIQYLAPVWSDCLARASLAPSQHWAPALQALTRRGRSRIQLQAAIMLPDGQVAATLQARYALLAPTAATASLQQRPGPG